MPLVCDELSQNTVDMLNTNINRLPENNPLRKESDAGNIIVRKENDAVIYISNAGFHFSRIQGNLESTIIYDICHIRNSVCVPLVLNAADPMVIKSVLNRFVEQHGAKLASQIDYTITKHNGSTLMLCNLPSGVLKNLLADKGGFLETRYSGPAKAIDAIPTLHKLSPIVSDHIDGDGIVRSVFSTQYNPGQYTMTLALHYKILQEVIKMPNSRITLYSVGAWQP